MATAPALAIRLLGGFAVQVGDRDIPARAWGSRKAQHLVKLLALAPGHRLTTDQLLDALWPDSDPAAARRTCYQTLYFARKVLDPDHHGLLPLHQEVVSLRAPGGVTVDLTDFQTAASHAEQTNLPADYERALALYSGDLLPEDRYADWAIVPRDSAQRRVQHVLSALAARYTEQEQPAEALTAWQRLLAIDPAHEGAHVALMRLYATSGQRQQALVQFRQLRTALRRELDASPDPASERLYAAILAGQPLPADNLPRGSRSAPPSPLTDNLPTPTTPLFGRADNIATIQSACRATRLVTLTGAGGCGKTRLALAVAQALRPSFSTAGVWWIDLASLADGGQVVETVARVLNIRAVADQPLRTTLVAALRARQLLIVLDNCEHLVEACATLAAALLAGCPQLQLLVTSRVALRVAGELVWRVPSLPVPTELLDAPSPDQLAALQANPAVQVFASRARLGQPDFQITPPVAPAVIRICRQLDGLPLALELAAARVALLTPDQLAARLDQALRILTGGPRTALPRHQTLRATLDWSYQLLDGAEQVLLARLAVFAGGWTLDAAEAVVGDEGGDERDDVLVRLAALVEQSLVQVTVPHESAQGMAEVRYELLETVRQFAGEQLAALEEASAYRERHARHYARLAAATTAAPDTAWLARLHQEVDNVRAALAWWRQQGAATAGLTLANDLYMFWRRADYTREGLYWLATAFAEDMATVPDAVRGQALSNAGFLACFLSDNTLAEGYLTRALPLLRATNQPAELAYVLNAFATIERDRGDAARARAYLDEARALFRANNHLAGLMTVATNLGGVAYDQGDLPLAEESYREAVAISREGRLIPNLPGATFNLGHLLLVLGQVAPGIVLLREALQRSHEQHDWFILHFSFANLGWLHSRQDRPELAARFLGTAATLQARLGLTLPALLQQRFLDPAIVAARTALGDVAYAQADALGRGWSLDEAISQADAALAALSDA